TSSGHHAEPLSILLCVFSVCQVMQTLQQSQRQLAQAALSVSLARAQSTSAFVSRIAKTTGLNPRVYQAVQDCIDNMAYSVDQLNQSVQELGYMGRGNGQDFMWHASNVQTWVSAALTDENTCVNGFADKAMDGNVKAAIKSRVISVAQVTSNALALVNRFATRHRAGAAHNIP
ncbi:unnamed protein product, partial [Ilex paraguariensis]